MDTVALLTSVSVDISDDSKPSKSAVSCIKHEYLEDDLHNTFIMNDKWTGSWVDVAINGGVTEHYYLFLLSV